MTHYWSADVVNIKVASEAAEPVFRVPSQKEEDHNNTFKRSGVLYDYAPTMMAVDLYSGLKGQRLRPSSITASPSSSLSSANVDVFWRQTQTANVPQAQCSETLLTVKSEVSNLKFILSTYSFQFADFSGNQSGD